MRKRLLRGVPFTDGYMTVEAVCILPFALAVILFVTYLWFFQYDRCLMDQDLGVVVVRTAQKQEIKADERVAFCQLQIANIYRDAYAVWELKESEISLGRGKLSVSLEGALDFPFFDWSFWSDDTTWEAGAVHQGEYYEQMLLLRTFRKIKGAWGSFVSEK